MPVPRSLVSLKNTSSLETMAVNLMTKFWPSLCHATIHPDHATLITWQRARTGLTDQLIGQSAHESIICHQSVRHPAEVSLSAKAECGCISLDFVSAPSAHLKCGHLRQTTRQPRRTGSLLFGTASVHSQAQLPVWTKKSLDGKQTACPVYYVYYFIVYY